MGVNVWKENVPLVLNSTEKFLVGVHGKSQVFLGVYFTPVTMLTTLSTTKTKIML